MKEIEDKVYDLVTLSTLRYSEMLNVLENVRARIEALPAVKFRPVED